MIGTVLLLTTGWLAATPLTAGHGAIRGTVINATRDRAATAGTEVILQARMQGSFVPVAMTETDDRGSFLFGGLPTDGKMMFLPGANRGDVHYPGPRLRLTPERPDANVKLSVYETVSEPNPLIIAQYEIVVHPQPGSLHVTEAMLIENASSTCYVGRPAPGSTQTVTMRLAIPRGFERATFDREFFGRRFSLDHGQPVTGVPWPPGKRELRFSYVIANDQRHRVWQRPLDLPCANTRLVVQTDNDTTISANLRRAQPARRGEVVFESSGEMLAAGYPLRLELDDLPVPMMAHAPWIALAALIGLIGGACLLTFRRESLTCGRNATRRRPGQQRNAGKRPGRRRFSSATTRQRGQV